VDCTSVHFDELWPTYEKVAPRQTDSSARVATCVRQVPRPLFGLSLFDSCSGAGQNRPVDYWTDSVRV
jgi:hypothetical protein